jgi:hypothetical protein
MSELLNKALNFLFYFVVICLSVPIGLVAIEKIMPGSAEYVWSIFRSNTLLGVLLFIPVSIVGFIAMALVLVAIVVTLSSMG